MAPKRQSTRVTFERTVKSNSDTRVKKRKMQGSAEQTSGKRQRSNSPEDKDGQLIKRQNARPLHTAVLQYIEACFNTAEMLLKFCKKIRLPVTTVHKVKNLDKDILEEQRKMMVYEDTLESLKHEIEEAVETTEKIEDSIVALEGKIEAMKKLTQDQIVLNIDPLELPQRTFEAPTMQGMAKKLKNPKLLLKAISQVQSNPIYKNALNLLQMSYAETSTL